MSSRKSCVRAWTAGLVAQLRRPVGRVLGGVLTGLALVLGSNAAGSGLTVTQITDSSSFAMNPDISGSNVVWQRWDGHDMKSEIYLWDGASTTRVTSNNMFDWLPRISGSNVVRACSDGTHYYEICFWDGASTTRITNNNASDLYPAISGSNVVWQHCDSENDDWCEFTDWEIYLWDGSTITQITDNSIDDLCPAISGSNVVWSAHDGNDWENYLWDGSTISQITDNSVDDGCPAISGSNVVFNRCDGGTAPYCTGGDLEIYLWNGVTTTRITDNSIDDEGPDISGANAVWSGCDRSDFTSCEIYLWDGSSVTQVTDNSTVDVSPAISGANVVWRGSDEYGGDIYMTTVPGLTIAVEIDIRPGNDQNFVDPSSEGLVPVALLGSDDFDVADADVTTLAFGPAEAAPAFDLTNPWVLLFSRSDVNDDGKTDLISHYRIEETGIAMGDTQACLSGQTLDGVPIQGCDAVTTLPRCGLGSELIFVLPPLMGWRARRRRA